MGKWAHLRAVRDEWGRVVNTGWVYGCIGVATAIVSIVTLSTNTAVTWPAYSMWGIFLAWTAGAWLIASVNVIGQKHEAYDQERLARMDAEDRVSAARAEAQERVNDRLPNLSGHIRRVQAFELNAPDGPPPEFARDAKLFGRLIIASISNRGAPSIVKFVRVVANNHQGEPLEVLPPSKTYQYHAPWFEWPSDFEVLNIDQAQTTRLETGAAEYVFVKLLFGGSGELDDQSMKLYFTDVYDKEFEVALES